MRSADELPPGWIAVQAEDGHQYFANIITSMPMAASPIGVSSYFSEPQVLAFLTEVPTEHKAGIFFCLGVDLHGAVQKRLSGTAN